MLNALSDIWETFTLSSFGLQDIEGFPFNTYEEQLVRYEEAERWFKGVALNDQPESPGEDIDIYPLRINPLISTVLKHAYILFGETQDDGRPLVVPKLIPANDGEKELASEAEEQLNYLWWENNGRSIMMENAILSQVYGGSVLKATYVPWEDIEYGGWRGIPIRIERVNPKNFVGIPDASDYYRLREAWVVKRISKAEAEKWGYTGDDEIVWRVEHWTLDEYEILIDGKPATRMTASGAITLSGPNPFGLVPIVYIPHIRTGDFYGINTFDQLKGMVRELNLRFGDYGDAVNEDAHTYVAFRNVQGTPQLKTIADGLPAIDLGSSAAISGNEPDPDMFEITKQRASSAMESLVNEIYSQYRRDSFVPAVAEGEDEGSQRSGLTLAIRFWPLTSHAGQERIFWADGLDVFHSYLLRMMAIKELRGITTRHATIRMKEKWAPMLPRDREVDVQEWVQRAAVNLGSIEHLLELTGDVEDIEEEKKRILEWVEDLKKLEQKYAPKPAMPGQNGSNPSTGGTGAAKPPGGGSS